MSLSALKQQISLRRFYDEAEAIQQLLDSTPLDESARLKAVDHAAELVHSIRSDSEPGLMEQFLAEYELSTREGIALMCLAEAYLRTPDALSLDALIRDKIGPGDWGSHVGTADSFLVNASSWALMLTGRMFRERKIDELPMSEVMLETISRLGDSLTQKAIQQAMKILGKQFVLGRDITEALQRSRKGSNRDYRYSYDMLGEAARTALDAKRYHQAYAAAITAIAREAGAAEVHDNPGISVKLSALHPRYEYVQRERIMEQLVSSISSLAQQACQANIGFTIDAEESERLELSLELIETVLSDPQLAGWDGFGVVVQAYSKQAPLVIRWLHELALKLNRRITVRLVKGAYWDSEIKQAQVPGMENYPVFTRKLSTDVSYLCCARILLDATDVIYPQFATHNAHTTSAILQMAQPHQKFEFQRLHGMGEALHRLLMKQHHFPTRIYAPVGVHKDLLAYLVRRLLENAANSSFVHKLLDINVAVNDLISDPFKKLQLLQQKSHPGIPLPPQLYGDARVNSSGLNLNLPYQAKSMDEALQKYKSYGWKASPMVAGQQSKSQSQALYAPYDRSLKVGECIDADEAIIEIACNNAQQIFSEWSQRPVDERAAMLEKIADLYQQNQVELIALAMQEAGKTRLDGILEVREAIDFCRYYAIQARRQLVAKDVQGIGPVVCISPWNFPLAIFTGQVVAALVCGNPVLAKPAEQTPLIAARAVELMHQAGIPQAVLQFIPGEGATAGRALTSNSLVRGVCFTGSTETASLIDRALAKHADPDCRLLAETGGLNTMIIDSTALLEQAVRDIVASSFQSAGQRCSALRILCVQKDIEKPLLEMLEGAAQQLVIGDPWDKATDVGPVIDEEARRGINDYCEQMTQKGRLLFQLPLPEGTDKGYFVPPTAFRLDSLDELKQEIFGPILHVYSFDVKNLDQLVETINSSGFGLTMGVQSRIDIRVSRICHAARVGNIYVNRNQIGAVVGVQPFGGEGLSGTGPKAGGPHYLRRFYRSAEMVTDELPGIECEVDKRIRSDSSILKQLKARDNQLQAQPLWSEYGERLSLLLSIIEKMPPELANVARSACEVDQALSFAPHLLQGPTGESNQFSLHGRGIVLCLGGGADALKSLLFQVFRSLHCGNLVKIPEDLANTIAAPILAAFSSQTAVKLTISNGSIEKQLLDPDISLVMFDGDRQARIDYRQLLASRKGSRVALESSNTGYEMLIAERVISTDTTASGGNASLLTLGDD